MLTSGVGVADISPTDKDTLRERLEHVIVHTLRKFPGLRYFQGYHDVSQSSVPDVVRLSYIATDYVA